MLTSSLQHNIITIVMHEKHIDTTGAMSWVAAKRRKLADDFIRLFNQVPSYTNLKLNHQVQEYVEGVAEWSMANYCWSLECGRYFGSEGRQVQNLHQEVSLRWLNR